jgi:phosphoribosyl 1,2-cyclic phosphodiesterase
MRELGMSLVGENDGPLQAHLFFSHMHWDHIQGFPFFVPAYSEKSQLNVYVAVPGQDRVKQLLHGQMSSDYFPVRFSDLGARIRSRSFEDQKVTVDGVTVTCFEQTHPGTSYAYAFEKAGTKVVYATDNELDLVLENRQASLDDPSVLRQAPPDFLDFIKDADLLIADGQYTDEEYPEKVGWGHARANTIVDVAAAANVRQCAIFHHDPMHSDSIIDKVIDQGRERAKANGAELTLFGAREGLQIKL